MADEEPWPGFTPFARAPKPPFDSGRSGDDVRTAGAAERQERRNFYKWGGGDRGEPSPAPDERDRTHKLLGALFEQAPNVPSGFEQSNNPREEAGARAEQIAGYREPADGRGEAEMFAIAFACCREMLFRLSDQFARRVPASNGAEEASGSR